MRKKLPWAGWKAWFKMLKSYRSTYEITEFTKRVSNKADVEAIERQGELPAIIAAENHDGEIEQIKTLINQFKHSSYNSLGIICKIQPEADRLHELLKQAFNIKLLNAISVAFGMGIVITTAHLAKGLEFDQVIVPHCTANNYNSAPDRQMLYVACTRAMHKLCITYTDEKSSFIP